MDISFVAMETEFSFDKMQESWRIFKGLRVKSNKESVKFELFSQCFQLKFKMLARGVNKIFFEEWHEGNIGLVGTQQDTMVFNV